jgi:hypothetical protein
MWINIRERNTINIKTAIKIELGNTKELDIKFKIRQENRIRRIHNLVLI